MEEIKARMNIILTFNERFRGMLVQSVPDRSLGVAGSWGRRIVAERQVSKEVRLRYQVD
jgi:hypothetical protein